LRGNAQDGNSYLVEITDDEYVAPDQTALPTDRSDLVVILRGRGEMRTVSLSANGSLFTVGSGVTLILDDNVTLMGRNANDRPLIWVGNDGTLIMEEGSAITDNTNTTTTVGGGGVLVNAGGKFHMEGGLIAGNRGPGAGVFVQNVSGYADAVFIMSGGKISDNEDSISGAGGVFVVSILTDAGGEAIFIMEGGKIIDNEAFVNHGVGGVFVVGAGATFTMKGGEITGNKAFGPFATGGVHVFFGGRFYMEDGKIIGNEAGGGQQHGGGVRVFDNNSTFIMRGGKIFDNIASGSQLSGGGVIASGGAFIMQGGKIFRNEDTGFDRTGGVFVVDNGTFQISNGIIYGVDAEDGRGNIGRTLNSWGGGTLEHGTFDNDGEFTPLGTLTATNYTIHVVNGELQ